MENKNRVVITGIGPVTSLGIGREALWSNLLDGKIVVSRIPERFEKNYSFHSKFYVPFPEFTLEDYGLPARYVNLMEETSKLSVLGTKLALEDAYLTEGDGKVKHYDPGSIQILIGIGIGSLETMLHTYAIHNFEKDPEILEKLNLKSRFNRMAIPSVMPNAASSWVSILFGIKGSNYTLNTSCSSGSYAIGEAYRKIRDGYADLLITGGVECLRDQSGTVMRGFDILRALTKSTDGKPRPFSYDRSGFLFSEGGACIIILEEYQKALKRGARIFGEIIGYEANSDAHNVVMLEPEGKQINQLFKRIKKNYKIDYINTHGTATTLNDKTECKVIREIFGDKEDQPLINSTKSMMGHTIGASGSIELAVTALSIYESKVHANLAENTFEDLNLAKETTEMDIQYAISTSYGFGGHNCALLLKKINHSPVD